MSEHDEDVAAVGRYLRSGPDQAALVDSMDQGHARVRHGQALGDPTPDALRTRIARHLSTAPTVFAVDSEGPRCYLIVDHKANQVAWIPPHKDQRSTFFQPDDGVADYLATKGRLGKERLTRLDPKALRAEPAQQQATRVAAHATASAQRSPRGRDRGR